MDSQTVVMCVVALILGMLLANMLKNVCGCKNVIEGAWDTPWEYYDDQSREDARELCNTPGIQCLEGWEKTLE